MSPSKLIRFKNELRSVIHEDEDFICIIKLMNDGVFGEEVIGVQDKESGETLILWNLPGGKIAYCGILLVNTGIAGKKHEV